MAYLIYSWHRQIFIKKGHRRGNFELSEKEETNEIMA